MFCHGSDIDMTSHVPIVLSLGIIAHNLLRILSGPGSSLRQFNKISTFSLSNTSSDKSAKKIIISAMNEGEAVPYYKDFTVSSLLNLYLYNLDPYLYI